MLCFPGFLVDSNSRPDRVRFPFAIICDIFFPFPPFGAVSHLGPFLPFFLHLWNIPPFSPSVVSGWSTKSTHAQSFSPELKLDLRSGIVTRPSSFNVTFSVPCGCDRFPHGPRKARPTVSACGNWVPNGWFLFVTSIIVGFSVKLTRNLKLVCTFPPTLTLVTFLHHCRFCGFTALCWAVLEPSRDPPVGKCSHFWFPRRWGNFSAGD